MGDSSDVAGGVAGGSKAGVKKAAHQWPEVSDLSMNDIIEVIALGIRDFRTAPAYGLFFGVFYAVGGIALVLMLRNLNLPYLIYPLAMGFALIAPFCATGIYEVSRRLERDQPLSWKAVFGSVVGSSGRDLGWMALVTCFTFIIWMDIAALMFFGFFGMSEIEPWEMTQQIFTTVPGIAMLVIGNLVGAIIATAVFSYSVVSFPMLLDRDIDFVTAMVTSVKTVLRNPVPMLFWALIVGVSLLVSVLSAFLGLIIVLPVLGHASWHLYRRAVAPAE